MDKLNEANPLYAAGVDALGGANAYEIGDYVGVGRSVLGFGVTVLTTAITLKGAKTTREPPKTTDYTQISDPKNVQSSTRRQSPNVSIKIDRIGPNRRHLMNQK